MDYSPKVLIQELTDPMNTASDSSGSSRDVLLNEMLEAASKKDISKVMMLANALGRSQTTEPSSSNSDPHPPANDPVATNTLSPQLTINKIESSLQAAVDQLDTSLPSIVATTTIIPSFSTNCSTISNSSNAPYAPTSTTFQPDSPTCSTSLTIPTSLSNIQNLPLATSASPIVINTCTNNSESQFDTTINKNIIVQSQPSVILSNSPGIAGSSRLVAPVNQQPTNSTSCNNQFVTTSSNILPAAATTTTQLPPSFSFLVSPINSNGEFPQVSLSYPPLPQVLLQIRPLQGVRMSESYTINVSTDLILQAIATANSTGSKTDPITLSVCLPSTASNLSSITTSGALGPITASTGLTHINPLPTIHTPLSSVVVGGVSVPKSNLQLPSSTPTSKRVRAIAPKPIAPSSATCPFIQSSYIKSAKLKRPQFNNQLSSVSTNPNQQITTTTGVSVSQPKANHTKKSILAGTNQTSARRGRKRTNNIATTVLTTPITQPVLTNSTSDSNHLPPEEVNSHKPQTGLLQPTISMAPVMTSSSFQGQPICSTFLLNGPLAKSNTGPTIATSGQHCLFSQPIEISNNTCPNFPVSLYNSGQALCAVGSAAQATPSTLQPTASSTLYPPRLGSVDPITGLVTQYAPQNIPSQPHSTIPFSSVDNSTLGMPIVYSQSGPGPINFFLPANSQQPSNQLVYPMTAPPSQAFYPIPNQLQQQASTLTSTIMQPPIPDSQNTLLPTDINLFTTHSDSSNLNFPCASSNAGYSSNLQNDHSNTSTINLHDGQNGVSGQENADQELATSDLLNLAWRLTMDNDSANNQDITQSNVTINDTTGDSSIDRSDEIVLLDESNATEQAPQTSADSKAENDNKQDETTGDATIDALLAAAAIVGAASGVGNDLAAVSVPAPDSDEQSTGNYTGDNLANSPPSTAPSPKQVSGPNIVDGVDLPTLISPVDHRDLLNDSLLSDFHPTSCGQSDDNIKQGRSNAFHSFDESTSLVEVLGRDAVDAVVGLESVLDSDKHDLDDGESSNDAFLNSLAGGGRNRLELDQSPGKHVFDEFPVVVGEALSDPGDITDHLVPTTAGCVDPESTENYQLPDWFGHSDGVELFNSVDELTLGHNNGPNIDGVMEDDLDVEDEYLVSGQYTTAEQFDAALLLLGPQVTPPLETSSSLPDKLITEQDKIASPVSHHTTPNCHDDTDQKGVPEIVYMSSDKTDLIDIQEPIPYSPNTKCTVSESRFSNSDSSSQYAHTKDLNVELNSSTSSITPDPVSRFTTSIHFSPCCIATPIYVRSSVSSKSLPCSPSHCYQSIDHRLVKTADHFSPNSHQSPRPTTGCRLNNDDWISSEAIGPSVSSNDVASTPQRRQSPLVRPESTPLVLINATTSLNESSSLDDDDDDLHLKSNPENLSHLDNILKEMHSRVSASTEEPVFCENQQKQIDSPVPHIDLPVELESLVPSERFDKTPVKSNRRVRGRKARKRPRTSSKRRELSTHKRRASPIPNDSPTIAFVENEPGIISDIDSDEPGISWKIDSKRPHSFGLTKESHGNLKAPSSPVALFGQHLPQLKLFYDGQMFLYQHSDDSSSPSSPNNETSLAGVVDQPPSFNHNCRSPDKATLFIPTPTPKSIASDLFARFVDSSLPSFSDIKTVASSTVDCDKLFQLSKASSPPVTTTSPLLLIREPCDGGHSTSEEHSTSSLHALSTTSTSAAPTLTHDVVASSGSPAADTNDELSPDMELFEHVSCALTFPPVELSAVSSYRQKMLFEEYIPPTCLTSSVSSSMIGGFAGAAAFRSTSFHSLATKGVQLSSFMPRTSELSFADIANGGDTATISISQPITTRVSPTVLLFDHSTESFPSSCLTNTVDTSGEPSVVETYTRRRGKIVSRCRRKRGRKNSSVLASSKRSMAAKHHNDNQSSSNHILHDSIDVNTEQQQHSPNQAVEIATNESTSDLTNQQDQQPVDTINQDSVPDQPINHTDSREPTNDVYQDLVSSNTSLSLVQNTKSSSPNTLPFKSSDNPSSPVNHHCTSSDDESSRVKQSDDSPIDNQTPQSDPDNGSPPSRPRLLMCFNLKNLKSSKKQQPDRPVVDMDASQPDNSPSSPGETDSKLPTSPSHKPIKLSIRLGSSAPRATRRGRGRPPRSAQAQSRAPPSVSSSVVVPESSPTASSVQQQSAVKPTSSLMKKIFSTARQDRRSSCARMARPFGRLNTLSSNRQRKSFDKVSTSGRPPFGGVRRRGRPPLSRPPTNVADNHPPNPLRIVIRLGGNEEQHSPSQASSSSEEDSSSRSSSNSSSSTSDEEFQFAIAGDAFSYVDPAQARLAIVPNPANLVDIDSFKHRRDGRSPSRDNDGDAGTSRSFANSIVCHKKSQSRDRLNHNQPTITNHGLSHQRSDQRPAPVDSTPIDLRPCKRMPASQSRSQPADYPNKSKRNKTNSHSVNNFSSPSHQTGPLLTTDSLSSIPPDPSSIQHHLSTSNTLFSAPPSTSATKATVGQDVLLQACAAAAACAAVGFRPTAANNDLAPPASWLIPPSCSNASSSGETLQQLTQQSQSVLLDWIEANRAYQQRAGDPS